MKKKIKDLTLEEVFNYCEQRFDCENCPFQSSNIKYDCLGVSVYRCIEKKTKFENEEIEVEDYVD